MASGGIRVVHIYPMATVPTGYARELIISLLLVSCVGFRTKLSVTSENVSTIDRTKRRGAHKSFKLIISGLPHLTSRNNFLHSSLLSRIEEGNLQLQHV